MGCGASRDDAKVSAQAFREAGRKKTLATNLCVNLRDLREKSVPQIPQILAEWVAVLDNRKSWRDSRESEASRDDAKTSAQPFRDACRKTIGDKPLRKSARSAGAKSTRSAGNNFFI